MILLPGARRAGPACSRAVPVAQTVPLLRSGEKMLDFKRLNEDLPALAVLQALRLQAASYTCEEWRGRCPYHQSSSKRPRSLAVSLSLRKFVCHRCGAHGDLIDLWSKVRGVPLWEAGVDLKREFLSARNGEEER